MQLCNNVYKYTVCAVSSGADEEKEKKGGKRPLQNKYIGVFGLNKVYLHFIGVLSVYWNISLFRSIYHYKI